MTRDASNLIGRNLAWIYYSTLEISLRTNFLFLSKSKIATAAAYMVCFFNNSECNIMIWKKSGIDILLDHRNKLAEEFFICHKSKMAAPLLRKITKSAITRKLYKLETHFSRPMFSRVRNAIRLSFAFYDHNNYSLET